MIQQKKFNKLLTEFKPKQDDEKVIFNFSNVSLAEAEKSFYHRKSLVIQIIWLILKYFIETMIT